jgi:hypothetical protein
MTFGTWNVRSPHGRSTLKKVAREFRKYKLALVGVQEVGWEKGREYMFLWKREGG